MQQPAASTLHKALIRHACMLLTMAGLAPTQSMVFAIMSMLQHMSYCEESG